MTKTQELKMQIVKQYGMTDEPETINFCREVYKFLTEDEPKAPVNGNLIPVLPPLSAGGNSVAAPANGVYIVNKDGSYELFTPEHEYPEAAFIGIAHDGHTFGVPFESHYGKSRLLNKDEYPKDDHCVSEADALFDWDFVAATEYIMSLGSPIKLEDGHYLPTAPVFITMHHYREELNAALNYLGYDTIDFDEDYWFAQRCGVYHAWLFGGTLRMLDSDGVCYAYQVRPVSLWPSKA